MSASRPERYSACRIVTVRRKVETYIYVTHLPGDAARSLLATTQEEVDSFVSAQERNQFIPPAKRKTFESLGRADGVLGNRVLSGDFDSFGFSAEADCGDLDLSSLASPRFRTFAVHNASVLSNKTFPRLDRVEELVLGGQAGSVDLGKFPNLKVLRILEWSPGIRFNGSSKAALVTVGDFKGAFQQLDAVKDATELVLNRAAGVDLQGIEIFQHLTNLEIHYAPKLKDIQSVSGLHGLTSVTFESCKKLSDFSPLGACKQLSSIIIGECGRISGLSFLVQLKNLRKLVIVRTSIADRDRSVLNKLKLDLLEID